MHRTRLTTVFVVAAAWATIASGQAMPPKTAIYIPSADVEATLAKAPKDGTSDQQIRNADMGAYNVGVGLVHRAAAQARQTAISHPHITEIYYVLRGTGTLVTGGTLVSPTPYPNNLTAKTAVGPSISGTAIDGGERTEVGPGDIVIVPPGVAHWFAKINSDMTFLEFRTDPEHVLQSPYSLFESK
jgi:mannose-6-phosphate isomerase-like protein (cupin superfamily)